MTSFKANDASITVARMVNAAGNVVSPTQAAVQAAMAAFRPAIDTGTLLAAELLSCWPKRVLM
jgi:hypothetical protein